jgi:mannose-6-phosphate isomerase-like protein (cupin superfamily)
MAHLGDIGGLARYGIKHPLIPHPTQGKIFLKELLGMTALEISFGLMPAGKSIPFHHKHRSNEEIYLFLKGRGQIQIDGEVMEVAEGTAVRIAPDGVRAFRNTSQEDMFYVVIQAKQDTLATGTTSDGVSVPSPVEWPA